MTPDKQAEREAPANNLPTWGECDMRVANSEHFAKQVAEGGYGPGRDIKLASQLHRFIHEYDDADPYRSSWFLHRLELLLNETKEQAIASHLSGAQKKEGEVCGGCNGHGMVGNIFDTQECPFCKGSGVEPAAAEAPAIIALAESLYDDGYDSGTSECCNSRHNSKAAKEHALKEFADALAAQPKADSHKTHDWQHHATHFTCKRCGLMSASGQEIVCTGKADSTEAPDVSDAEIAKFFDDSRIFQSPVLASLVKTALSNFLALRPKAQPLTEFEALWNSLYPISGNGEDRATKALARVFWDAGIASSTKEGGNV